MGVRLGVFVVPDVAFPKKDPLDFVRRLGEDVAPEVREEAGEAAAP